MEFAARTYRTLGFGSSKAISIETVNNGENVRLTIEKNSCNSESVSIDLSKTVAKRIRDHLNEYLNE